MKFDKRDWRRGEEYFRSDAVLIVDRAAHFLKAEVQGSAASPYDVSLDWSAARGGVLRVGWEDARASGARTATRRKTTAGRNRRGRAKSRKAPDWKRRLVALAHEPEEDLPFLVPRRRSSSKPRQFWYLLDAERTRDNGRPCIALRQRTIKKDCTPGKLKALKLTRAEIDNLPSAEDRTLLGLLAGNERDLDYGPSVMPYGNYWDLTDCATVAAMFDILLPRLCASGRFGWLPDDGLTDDEQVRLLAWDDGPPRKVTLHVTKSPDRKHWQLDARLERGAAVEELSRPLLLLASGLVMFPDRIARLDAGDDFRWIVMLREGPLLVPVKQAGAQAGPSRGHRIGGKQRSARSHSGRPAIAAELTPTARLNPPSSPCRKPRRADFSAPRPGAAWRPQPRP
ncbi:MAG: hypothetical protein HYX69_15275 [Planctomycetia bacterium]|nr:hypothetical protein [Planctomycetia bacterium]